MDPARAVSAQPPGMPGATKAAGLQRRVDVEPSMLGLAGPSNAKGAPQRPFRIRRFRAAISA
jgi:hypothetical protein